MCPSSFQGVKRPDRDVDHSPSLSAEVKYEWSYTSTLQRDVHGVHRDNFTVCAARNVKVNQPLGLITHHVIKMDGVGEWMCNSTHFLPRRQAVSFTPCHFGRNPLNKRLVWTFWRRELFLDWEQKPGHFTWRPGVCSKCDIHCLIGDAEKTRMVPNQGDRTAIPR